MDSDPIASATVATSRAIQYAVEATEENTSQNQINQLRFQKLEKQLLHQKQISNELLNHIKKTKKLQRKSTWFTDLSTKETKPSIQLYRSNLQSVPKPREQLSTFITQQESESSQMGQFSLRSTIQPPLDSDSNVRPITDTESIQFSAYFSQSGTHHNTTISHKPVSKSDLQPYPKLSRRTVQRRKKRLLKKKITSNNVTYTQLIQQKINCLEQIYGFTYEPDKSKRYNFNKALNIHHTSTTTRTVDDTQKTHLNSLFQLQPKNLAVHNLCKNSQPPPGTKNLLGLGLKFCTVPPKPSPNLTDTMLKLAYKIRTKHYLLNHNRHPTNDYIPQLYKKLQGWHPPPAPNTTEDKLTTFEKLLKEALHHNSKRKHFFRGLTPQQLKTLKELKNSQDFIILPMDKNLRPAILNRKDYITQVLSEHFLTNSYQNLPAESANHRITETKQLLKNMFYTHKN
jgi:hypothetical protein